MGDGLLSPGERFERVPFHPGLPEKREKGQFPEDRHPEEAPWTERSSGSTPEDDVRSAWLQKPGSGHTRQYYEDCRQR